MDITNLPSKITAGSASVTKVVIKDGGIGDKFVKIKVTAGSFKFNARGGAVMTDSPDYVPDDELHFSTTSDIFYFKAASGSDTFNIEWL